LECSCAACVDLIQFMNTTMDSIRLCTSTVHVFIIFVHNLRVKYRERMYYSVLLFCQFDCTCTSSRQSND
jgi:hypothetical protein